MDVANGYTELFLDLVKRVRDKFDNPLIAGNVVTGEMTEALILAGADIVKIGIGTGSVCTTRTVTGVGYPQLSAIIECADAAHGLRGHVISDGGCSTPGDVSKAFGAGADFVMLGGMLAGHKESGGKVIERDGKKYKEFYGMSSDTAMERYYGDIKEYRASEGESISLEYRGPIDKTVQQILGGVRSAATYIGAKDLKNIPKCIICDEKSRNTIIKNCNHCYACEECILKSISFEINNCAICREIIDNFEIIYF